MERFCRECGAPLSGRSDKKFCSDACRTAFHNRQYYIEKRPTQAINRILRQNRWLLERVYLSGRRKVSLDELQRIGYDMRFATRVERSALGASRYHCYEYSYSIRHGAIIRLEKTDMEQ